MCGQVERGAKVERTKTQLTQIAAAVDDAASRGGRHPARAPRLDSKSAGVPTPSSSPQTPPAEPVLDGLAEAVAYGLSLLSPEEQSKLEEEGATR